MPYYKFHEDDLFINTIKAEPQYSFYIYSGSVYIDNIGNLKDKYESSVPHRIRDNSSRTTEGVPHGFISLYEYNIDRPVAERIYPFVYKDGKRNSFKSISKLNYDTQYSPGDIVTSSYVMSASISRGFATSIGLPQYPGLQSEADYLAGTTPTVAETTRRRMEALKNTLDHYSYMSPHYAFSGSTWYKGIQTINLISIPSIFYGSSIEKGTVKLDFYVSGSLVGRLTDSRKNGELVQESGTISTNDGEVAGVVLYNEGFIILTGSWNLDSTAYTYDASSKPAWIYWGYGCNDGNIVNTDSERSSSFLLEYSGSTEIQTLTMLAHAKYGELNYSNNPTSYSASVINKKAITKAFTGSFQYTEKPIKVNNIVSASYTDQEPPYKKTVYISKLGVYDENKNLIGVAKLATPVRKTEDLDFTFKIKLDI